MNKQSENTVLKLESVSIDIYNEKIVEDISFELKHKDWMMLVGPNGAGKSSILRAISRNMVYSGEIFVYDKNIVDIKNAEYAKTIGFLSQNNFIVYDFSVEEIVAMGRYCHKGGVFRNLDNNDNEKIDLAIKEAGIESIRKKSIQELSGGEVQRTFIAQLFAQDPKIFVLDEPTNNLDLLYQKQIFELLQKWINEKNVSILSVVHDLSLAKLYGTKAVLLDNGKIIQVGDTDDVIAKENLLKAYKMDVETYTKNLLSTWN